LTTSGGSDTFASLAVGRKLIAALALTAGIALAMPAIAGAATPKTITVAADSPSVGNCWPFDEAINPDDPTDVWTPYFGFVYKNIPPFEVKRGDTLAFDLGSPNTDHDIQVEIAMAPAANGTDTNTGVFTTIVPNTQTPASPRGNDVVGDYELAFTAQAAFNFAGGGLIIRISNPGPSFIEDQSCDVSLVGAADETDPSGFFVSRVYTDADGVSPWDHGDEGPVGQFRLTLQPESNSFSFGKLVRNKKKGTAMLPVTVPGRGRVALSGKGVKALPARASVATTAEGTVQLPIRAKGKVKKRLFASGKAKLRVSVTFTPTSDPAEPPATQTIKLKLRKKLR
jgi:hypothetical protein